MTLLQTANDISLRIENEISTHSSVLKKYPLEKYIILLEKYPEVSEYNYISPEIIRYTNRILSEYDQNLLVSYHKLLLVALIKKNIEILPNKKLPDSIKHLYLNDFKRIISDIETLNDESDYTYSQDVFLKKLALCSYRLIPVGARKINCSKLPIKKFIFNKGPKQLISVLLIVFFELKGISPLYIGHLDTNDLDLISELNEQGLRGAYLRIVDLLKLNPKIKGYFGTSWLLDPKLDQINTRHQYNRKIVIKNGGKLFYKGPSASARKNSLKKSRTRRMLYEQGKYVPTDYVIVWSRKKIIEWADKTTIHK